MAHAATDQEVRTFEAAHEEIQKTLNLGQEILWLTQEECIKAGPDIDHAPPQPVRPDADRGRAQAAFRGRKGTVQLIFWSAVRRGKKGSCYAGFFFWFARHGRALTGESPEHA